MCDFPKVEWLVLQFLKMMAGTGVSVAGAGMLRTRRRDVSVKPNRKLDRKSSRGMIYENEELRLRTIHINAEVEQGQNDIKKLRRENEQLRREIWSLRDEYDKLEEILKRQKSRGDSEEYEDRSDEDDGLQSDYSFEEDEGVEESAHDSDKEASKSEQLENAENQKLSSEKMTTNTLHRLHVDFDDLSVVDEEEEPKREKDRKDIVPQDADQPQEDKASPKNPPTAKSRLLHENIPFYPGTYQPPACLNNQTYYTDCPFKFPSTLNLMVADTSGILSTDCQRVNPDPLMVPNPGCLDQVSDHVLHAPPAGWQSNVILPQKQLSTFASTEVDGPSRIPTFVRQDQVNPAATSNGRFPVPPGFFQKRNPILKQTVNPFEQALFEDNLQANEKATNGWTLHPDSSAFICPKDQNIVDLSRKQDFSTSSGTDKPKHFFAPLPTKLKGQAEGSSATISNFGTGNSSSSGKTGSTVVCGGHPASGKGCADLYVSGAVPLEDHFVRGKSEQRTFLSTDNLLVTEDKSSAGNPLTKSMSCQDLSSEAASIGYGDARQLTQSDNTLDNKSETKPFRSHLSVTLKTPRGRQVVSPNTPEIPKLPSIDYKLFKNPFLRTFDPSGRYTEQNNVTRPLSVQVDDDGVCCYPLRSEATIFDRAVPFADRQRPVQGDKNRLLMPSGQLPNGKLMSPTSKHQIQVTSFERPSPRTLIGPPSPYDLNTLRRLNANPYFQNQNMYQNLPFPPRSGVYPPNGMMFYGNLTTKVPAQTQTSIDGDSHHEDEHALSHDDSAPNTPSDQRRRKPIRKEKVNLTREQKQSSPVGQRRLKKQNSISSSEVPESPDKGHRKKTRKPSVTTTTASEGLEDKNESRSSSSGQDSPKKEQIRRVSLYFNAKKRPSLASVKTARSGSLDTREKDSMLMNSERERTNSVSSRDMGKTRKGSTSSGNVPWCACWGNGCI